MTEETAHLPGGIANAGRVVRQGGFVLRPSSAATPLVQAFLGHLHARGFHACPEPAGVDAQGRERLAYIEGTVALAPGSGSVCCQVT